MAWRIHARPLRNSQREIWGDGQGDVAVWPVAARSADALWSTGRRARFSDTVGGRCCCSRWHPPRWCLLPSSEPVATNHAVQPPSPAPFSGSSSCTCKQQQQQQRGRGGWYHKETFAENSFFGAKATHTAEAVVDDVEIEILLVLSLAVKALLFGDDGGNRGESAWEGRIKSRMKGTLSMVSGYRSMAGVQFVMKASFCLKNQNQSKWSYVQFPPRPTKSYMCNGRRFGNWHQPSGEKRALTGCFRCSAENNAIANRLTMQLVA